MNPDVDKYRDQLEKNPARGKALRQIEEKLELEGSDGVLAQLLGERLDALELVAARPNIIDEVRARYGAALRRHARSGTESLDAARAALKLADLARRSGDTEARHQAALWALVRGVSDDEVCKIALEHAGGADPARELAKAGLSREEFKDRKGALRHVMSRLAEAAGDLDAAFFEALRAARTAPPMRRYLDETFRLALTSGRFEETALVFADAADGDDIGDELRAYLLLKLAHILANHLDRGADALDIYRKILELDPDSTEALKRATKLARRLGAEFEPPSPAPPPPPRDEPEEKASEEQAPDEQEPEVTLPAIPIPAPAPPPDLAALAALEAPPDEPVEDRMETDVTIEELEHVAQLPLASEASGVFAAGSDLRELPPPAPPDEESGVFAETQEESTPPLQPRPTEPTEPTGDAPGDAADEADEGGGARVSDDEGEVFASIDEQRAPTDTRARALLNEPPEPTTAPADAPISRILSIDEALAGTASDEEQEELEDDDTHEVGDAQIIEISDAALDISFDPDALKARGDFETLAAGLSARLGDHPDADALLQVADLYESRLSSPERAFPVFARALGAHDDERALAGLLRCAPSAPDAAAELCDDLLEHRGARDDAVASLARIVAAAEATAGELERAAARLATVFAKRSSDEGLFRQLDRLYEKVELPAKRAELRSRANFGDAMTRLGLLADRIDLLEEAGDLRAALATAYSLQAAKPRDESVAHRVVELAERLGDEEAIKEALGTLLGLEGGEAGLSTARRLADLAEQSGDEAASRAAWRDVLHRRPGDSDALRALSDLLEGDEALHDELAEVLKLRLTIARNMDDEALQLMVLHRLADVHDARGCPEEEEEALREALRVDPEDTSALDVVAGRLRARDAHEELAALYEELAGLHDDPAGQVQLLMQAAKIYRDELGRRQAARAAYERALERAPDDGEVLARLAEVCRELGDNEAAVGYLDHATRDQSGPGQASALYQLGQTYERELERTDEALDAYRRALVADRAHADANTALKRLYRSVGYWAELVELLEDQADHYDQPETAAQTLIEAANLLLEHEAVIDPERGEALLARAVERAPTQAAAREQLVDRLLAREDFSAARPHLDELERMHGADAMGLDHLVALAKACAQQGELEPAEEHLRLVLQRAPSHLAALRVLGDLLVGDGDADAEETIAVLEQRILHHGPELERAEAARVHGQIGILRRGRGDTAGARKALQHALSLMDPDAPNVDVLAAHAELLADEGAVEEALTELEQLARQLEGTQAAARWMQAAHIAEHQAEDFDRAAAAFAEVCRLDPDRLDAFEGQLRVEVARGHSEGALAAAEALLERELNPQRLSRLEVAVATICQETLNDPKRAARYLRQAVEHDPENTEARSAAEQLFEEIEDYASLERLLAEAIEALPRENTTERVTLLEKLAQIRRYELRDLKGAVKALERLLTLDADDAKAREDLGRLYTELGAEEDALRTWREVLARNPLALEAYRAMLSILRRRGRYDAAYCVAATMVALERADDDVRSIVKQLRPPFPSWPKVPSDLARVSDALVHPRARGPVRELLTLTAPMLWPHFAHSLRDFDLRRRDLLSAPEVPNSVAVAVRQAARVLDVEEPTLYRGGPDAVGISLLPIDPPALLVGVDVLRGGMTPERAFAFGRAIAYLRYENLLAASLSPTELRGIAEAVLLMAMPQVEMDRATRELSKLGNMIERRVSPQAADRLVELGRDYYKLRSSYSTQDLVSAISYGTDRVGFLFSGELAPAVAAIKAAAGREHAHSARLAIKELVLFSVSGEYFALRRELGLSVRKEDAQRVLKI